MRRNMLLFLMLGAFIFMMAGVHVSFLNGAKGNGVNDSIDEDTAFIETLLAPNATRIPRVEEMPDSASNDTTVLDSLHQAIMMHNKIIDDSIRLDSINRSKSNGIDAPVHYSARDSIVYYASSRTAYLYGKTGVKYENMDLSSERVAINMDSNIVRASGIADSLGNIEGKPVFKMGNDEYESKQMAFNFKTKKGFINDVYTEQEDGYLSGQHTKRDSAGVLYLEHGRYTTCDEEHPDFYIALSRAKVRPGKDVVFGPAYLVVCDVPLPLAIPYGFFPFTKKYSSGFIMPSYGDENSRGFYLRDGGYYFAISDKWDLKLIGEIYTKGSWGVTATSNYRKRYKYNGTFLVSYQDTKNGDKGMPDFTERESFKIQWTHSQDTKANPFTTLSAKVNFATSSYEKNNLTSMYNPQAMTQSVRTSSVSWSTRFSSLGMSLRGTVNLDQNMRDSTIDMTLPSLDVSVAPFYPFKRKHSGGKELWYEKINLSYTGQMSNSIKAKEDKILHTNLSRDWRNGMNHSIPIKANFTLLKYININPSMNFTDRMYFNKTMRSWDEENQTEVRDTINGFYNVYNWNLNIGVSTKLYGMFVPSRKLFGDKVVAIRHVLSPTVSFSYAPGFGSSRYGFYESYLKTDAEGNTTLVDYSPFEGQLYGLPNRNKAGTFNFTLGNNVEMKIRSDKDSTGFKKISIIDDLSLNMSYNMTDKERPWSDLNMNIRLKWWKNYTFALNARFATYAYDLDENGKPYVGTHTEWGRGRFGRFQGMSQVFRVNLNPEKLRKWFGGGGKDDDDEEYDDGEGIDTNIESNIDDELERGKHRAKKRKNKADTDDDGYMAFSMPWSLTLSYGISMRENTGGKFNYKTMRYPYKFSQTFNISGNIRISEGWNINFASGYDFENHKISMTTASLNRDLHCFNMSCSVVLAPYTSYNFTFRCNASTLTDALKYDKRSGYSNAVQWY
ncbi:MAG: LPS-assembly protein LptD [Prevotella sp.]|nr:LPS-assembly protein LptD [Prevotella sp.]